MVSSNFEQGRWAYKASRQTITSKQNSFDVDRRAITVFRIRQERLYGINIF